MRAFSRKALHLPFFIVLSLCWCTALAQEKPSEGSTYQRELDSVMRVDSVRRFELLAAIDRLKAADRQKRKMQAKLDKIAAADSVHQRRLQAEIERLRSDSTGYPVYFFGDSLFAIYTRIGSFSPQERAAAISKRVEDLYHNLRFKGDSLSVVATEMSADIVIQDEVIMTVNELEAAWFQMPATELARIHASTISNAIRAMRHERRLQNYAYWTGEALLVILVAFGVVVLVNYVHGRARTRLVGSASRHLKGVRINGRRFIDRDGQLQVVLFLLSFVRWVLIIAGIYLALPLLFGFFPWTEGIAKTMLAWIITPLSDLYQYTLDFMPNLFTIIMIVAFTHYLLRFFRFIADRIGTGSLTIPGFFPDWARPTFGLLRIIILAFAFIGIFPFLPGSHSPVFRGVSVFFGVLISLGSTSAISNAVAGFVMTFMRPFQTGDRIRIGDITGDVIEKSFLVIRVRTLKNELITIPNSSVLGGHITNYTTSVQNTGLILYTSVSIGYNTPWQQVHELLKQAAKNTAGILTDERHFPYVLQLQLNDFYVSYELNAFTLQPRLMDRIYSELHQNIQTEFAKAGVEIMSPHYRSVRDGNQSTTPAPAGK